MNESIFNDRIAELLDSINQQGNPIPNGEQETWQSVIEDMNQRNEFGKRKYNQSLQPFNGRNSCIDKYQEILDYCVYAKNDIIERKSLVNALKKCVDFLTDENLKCEIKCLLISIGESV
jgi:hypothetical protein